MFQNFILSLPSFVCIFSAVTLFFRRKSNSRSQNIWMVFMLLLSVPTYTWGWYYTREVENFSFYYKLDVLDSTLGLTIFPLIRLF